MADWATIAEVGTAAGTLVLAFATFGATRSANRSARIAERAFEARLRPVLVPSRVEDPAEKIMWGDNHWTRLPGGRASVEVGDEVVYLTMSLRNVGSGMAVIHAWRAEPSPGFVLELRPELLQHPELQDHPDLDDFRPQGRDLYVPPGDVGFWQSAIRDRGDPRWEPLARTIEAREQIGLELLYGDHEGGQPTITRFVFYHEPDEEHPNTEPWRVDVVRHWRPQDGDVHVL